ncbi:MAG TPA: hypothetical protein VF287_00900 [Usitatibacter sp.]
MLTDSPLGLVPGEFILFAVVLAGIALLQRSTLEVALTGLAAVTIYKLEYTGFAQGPASPASSRTSG